MTQKIILNSLNLIISFYLLICLFIKRLNLESSQNKSIYNSHKLIKRIMFGDFWPNFDPYDNLFLSLLSKHKYQFTVVSSQPDILIYSVFGQEHQLYNNCKRVFYSGEHKASTDLAMNRKLKCSLSLTFYPNRMNNIRFPFWLWKFLNKKYPTNMLMSHEKRTGFCSFVYSRTVKYRNNFCLLLSKYKQVSSGGKCLNNIGHKVSDKLSFQQKFRFGISFENSLTPGYVTEKILETYVANSIPIYLGSSRIKEDFNPETFINGHDFKNFEDLVTHVKKVDNDENLYSSYFNKPILSSKWQQILNDPRQIYFKNLTRRICS